MGSQPHNPEFTNNSENSPIYEKKTQNNCAICLNGWCIDSD